MSASIMMMRSKRSLAAHAIGTMFLWAASFDAIAQTPNLPPITDADREAAFPDLPGHAAHDQASNYYVLFDQLGWQNASVGSALDWDASA